MRLKMIKMSSNVIRMTKRRCDGRILGWTIYSRQHGQTYVYSHTDANTDKHSVPHERIYMAIDVRVNI